ncbi:MAG: protein jag [Anaerolineales bacterium]|nr:protein jag [Anaerolineales bacterium]
MNLRTTLEKIAPTVQEAIAEGLAELHLTPEDVEIEVLDSGSRGLLGIGSRQARVRLTVKAPPPPEPVAPLQAPVSSQEEKLLQKVRQTVCDLLEKMNMTASVTVSYGEADGEGDRPVLVDIRGNDLGVLIGRRGEILNAMQYLVNLIVSKQMEQWVQIILDVEGYRARRERQLRQMARRLAEQAVRTGRRQVLEPMPANERRIIHIELRDHPDVTTVSIGEEPARKVTIVPK